MKKTILTAMFAGLIGYMPCAFGILINAGNLQKKFTPEDATRLNYMNSGFGVSATRGPVEVKLYKDDTNSEFYFTTLQLNNNGDVLPVLTCEDVSLTMSSFTKIQGVLNATNTDITTTYLRISMGGELNMDGGKLTLTQSTNDVTYRIYSKMNLNNVEFSSVGSIVASTASGEPSSGNITFSGNTSFTGTELIATNGCSISVLDSSTVDVNSLDADSFTVSSNSKISVASAADISIDDLNVVLSESGALDFSDIFSADSGETIVFSAEQNISVYDGSGHIYEDVLFSYDESGNITGITAVPEPATYAAIFGVLVLAFAAYRRRG